MPRTPSPSSTLLLFLSAACLFVPLPARAADTVVGTWRGTVETARGASEITLDFKGTDEELQGTWTGPRGASELEDVAYRSDTLTFTLQLEMQGRSVARHFTATVDGDTMRVTMKGPRGERRFTLTRVR